MIVSIRTVAVYSGVLLVLSGLSTTAFGAVRCHQAQVEKHFSPSKSSMNIFEAKEHSLNAIIDKELNQARLALKTLDTPKKDWNPLESSLMEGLKNFRQENQLLKSETDAADFSPFESIERVLKGSKHFDFLSAPQLFEASAHMYEVLNSVSRDVEIKAALFHILMSHNRITDPQIKTEAQTLTERVDRIGLLIEERKVISMLQFVYPKVKSLAEFQSRLFVLPTLIQQTLSVPESSLRKLNGIAKAHQSASLRGFEVQTEGQVQAVASFKRLFETDPYFIGISVEIQEKILPYLSEMTTPESASVILAGFLETSNPQLKQLANEHRLLSRVRHHMDASLTAPSSNRLH